MRDFERKGCDQYGASMGRASNRAADLKGRVSLVRVRLDAGGYDKGGAYWGHDLPLYLASGDDEGVYYFRAKDRATAKAELLAANPELKFYR